MAQTDKVATVAEIADRFRSSNAAVITEYRGLTMAQLSELRRSLGRDTAYTVAKNTLVKRAAADAGVAGIDHLFVGPTAVAFVTGEPVDAAKALRDFARTHPMLVIKGGLLEGRALEPAEVTRLADLDSREVLLSKLAGAMKGTLTKAAIVLNALPTKTVQLVAALRDKQQETEGGVGGADLGVTETVEDAQSDSTAETPQSTESTESAESATEADGTDTTTDAATPA
jgi:large subunit ribosomal protein L10